MALEGGGSRRGSGGGGGGRRRAWRRGRLPPSVVVTRGWLVEVWARPWSQPLQRSQPLRGCGGQGGAPGVRGDLGGMKNFHLQTPKQNQISILRTYKPAIHTSLSIQWRVVYFVVK